MAEIFISYSSLDKKIANQLSEDLKKLGHTIWLDEWQIKVGESIPTKISRGIDTSDYLILLLSNNSIKSGWVESEWQSKYWEQVEKNKTMVLPSLLENCEIPKLLTHIKYADFRKSYAVGLVELTSSINPTIPRLSSSNITESDMDSQISLLIEKIQSKTEPLSKCIAETLTFARRYKLEKLEDFCKLELRGWHNTPNEKLPNHRLHEVFLSPFGQVNLNYLPWAGNPSVLFDYMRRESKQFFPRKLAFPESVSGVEEKARNNGDSGIFTLSMPLKYFVKETDTPEAPVQIYSRGSTYKDLLEAIRIELTNLLLEALPF